MTRLAALVCGLILGAVGMMGLPSQAQNERLKERVNRLERLVQDQDAQMERHGDRIRPLEGATNLLSPRSGRYLGEIDNDQVTIPLDNCPSNTDATWFDNPDDGREVVYLACIDAR